jgi:DNA-binding transcriptional regulator YhcF (GntR family)
MEYKNTEPIYLQIGERIYENILNRHWQEGDRIPSIRELAIETEVNPNTVMKTYSHLQNAGIIQNQRGIGYFISAGAYQKALAIKKDDFITNTLPTVFKTLELLGLDFEALKPYYEDYRAKDCGKKEERK